VLRALWRADVAGEASVRVTDLSDRLLIRPPSVTTVVDRLERQGLVLREGSASDQRVKEVRLTDNGKRLVRKIMHGHTAQIESVLDALSAPEQASLKQALERLNAHLSTLGEISTDESSNNRKSAKSNRKSYEVD
jgi:DNA-binding MarR family transcriptional regulator